MINHLKWLGRSACLSTLLLANPLYANENDDLRQRLNELESIVIDMEAKMGGKAIANSFSSDNFDIGGYYHGVAREFDTDGGTAAGFARNLLYLRIEADVSEKWSVSFGNLFGQVDGETPEYADIGAALQTDTDGDKIPDYLDETGAGSASYNEQLNRTPGQVKNLSTFSLNIPVDINVQYKQSDALKITFGRQRMPIGQFSLYPMSWRHVEIPRYMLPNALGVTNLFNPFIQGVSARGQFFPGDGAHILKYSAFAADTTVMSGGLEGVNNNEQSGFRVGYAKPDQSFSAGFNYIKGKREDRIIDGGNRFEVSGLDLSLNIKGFRLLTEYYKSDEGKGPQPNRTGYFVEPSYLVMPKLELVARHDVMDSPIYQISNQAYDAALAAAITATNTATGGALPASQVRSLALSGIAAAGFTEATVNAPGNLGKVVENTVGINYKPVENIRLRLLHGKRTYEDLGDYEVKITSLSATASF
jgi:hypothetical protein